MLTRRSILTSIMSAAAGCVLSRMPMVGPKVEAHHWDDPAVTKREFAGHVCIGGPLDRHVADSHGETNGFLTCLGYRLTTLMPIGCATADYLIHESLSREQAESLLGSRMVRLPCVGGHLDGKQSDWFPVGSSVIFDEHGRPYRRVHVPRMGDFFVHESLTDSESRRIVLDRGNAVLVNKLYEKHRAKAFALN